MKRYLLFCWKAYDAFSGWDNFIASYDSVKDAVRAANSQRYKSRGIILDSTDKIEVRAW